MELWFRRSELWSRSAPVTGSFPERRVSRRILSSLSFSITRSVFYFLFHVPFLDSQQSLIYLIRTRGRSSESASPRRELQLKKKSKKKCGPPSQEKLLPLGSRWYTRSRPEWLGVGRPRMFLFASMIWMINRLPMLKAYETWWKLKLVTDMHYWRIRNSILKINLELNNQ